MKDKYNESEYHKFEGKLIIVSYAFTNKTLLMKLNSLFSPAVFVIAFSIFISCKKSNNTASNPDKLKM